MAIVGFCSFLQLCTVRSGFSGPVMPSYSRFFLFQEIGPEQ